MENLRASRQDNPFIQVLNLSQKFLNVVSNCFFLQQVLASRESLIDTLDTEEDSDHANLMSKELSLEIDVDPFSLPELHEHMIRSPPPVNWPKSPNCRVFEFPADEETISVEVNVSKCYKRRLDKMLSDIVSKKQK